MGKPNKGKRRNPKVQTKAWVPPSHGKGFGTAPFPISADLLLCKQHLPEPEQGELHSYVTAAWESLCSAGLGSSSFPTVFAGAALAWLLPSVWDGCLAEGVPPVQSQPHWVTQCLALGLQLVFVSDFSICLTGMLGRLVNTCISLREDNIEV